MRHFTDNLPISVLKPVPITIPRHLPVAMFVPYTVDSQIDYTQILY
jgi:hypothetical protein